MSVSILIVAYHHADDLDECLAALQGHFPASVIDNSSSPNVAAVCSAHGVHYRDAGANLGFAAAVNRGLAELPDEDDVLLLNPDAIVTAPAINALSAALRAEPELAAVSPRLVSNDGSAQRVLWPYPTPGRMWREALGLNPGGQSRSEFVAGAVLLLRRAALTDVGGFDERFFLYAEETDWQFRAAARGWRSAVIEEAEATHAGAGTSDDESRRLALFHAGVETYQRKWHGWWGWQSYRLAAVLGAALRGVILPRERGRAARKRAALYTRGPRRMAGLG